jgi:uracil-DNA glycosylase
MRATKAEMPKKYWRNMPEAAAIPGLIRTAPARVEAMIDREAAVPARRDPARAVEALAHQGPRSLDELNRIIAAAEPLVPGATRAVLGEGPVGAAIAFVGEQPGDQEDRQGRPFVGPAGALLDRALEEVGVDRSNTYVTNAVKHFKFVLKGKKRIHSKPTMGEIKHYRWWLERELEFVAPRVVVALGGSAVTALTGRAMRADPANRGPTTFENRRGYITVHPVVSAAPAGCGGEGGGLRPLRQGPARGKGPRRLRRSCVDGLLDARVFNVRRSVECSHVFGLSSRR